MQKACHLVTFFASLLFVTNAYGQTIDEVNQNQSDFKITTGPSVSTDSILTASSAVFAFLSFGSFLTMRLAKPHKLAKYFFGTIVASTFILQIIFLYPIVSIVQNHFDMEFFGTFLNMVSLLLLVIMVSIPIFLSLNDYSKQLERDMTESIRKGEESMTG